MQALLTLLSLLSLLASCSAGKSAKTSFKIEMSHQGLSTGGGLVIFGKEIGGKNGRFARIVSSEILEMDIPRGVWSIGGIAWSGSAGNMTGTIVCGITTVELKADTVQVPLHLQNSTCFSPAISIENGFGADPNKVASGIDPTFCESDVGSTTGFCLYDKLDPKIIPKRGFIGGFRMSIPGGASFGGLPAGEILETKCFDPDTKMDSLTQSISLNTVNIPAFISGLGVPLHIDAYLGAGCEVEKGSLRLSFEDSNKARFDENGTSFKKLYGKTRIKEICDISEKSGTTGFASGNGSGSYPYVICTAKQLNHLSKFYTAALASYNYILGKDIDLSSLAGAGPTPADECIDAGDTFVPIGLYYTPTPCVLNNHSSPFTGSFDGNGYKVKNFRFKDSSAPIVGFIDEVDGSVSNIHFEKASIEGNTFTGIAVGNLSSTGQVYGIKVTDSDVRGENNTGAVVGASASATDLIALKAKNVKVEGRDYVGGLVGYTGNPITDSSFEGSVTSKYGNNNVGGIVGYSASNIIRSVSSGVIRSTAVKVGGIAGEAVNCFFCRSDMLVLDLKTSGPAQRLIGGIIGDGATVDSSLFLGNIQTNCGANTICEIGGLVGTNTATALHTDSYSVQSISGAGGLNGVSTDFSTLYADNTVYTALCASHVATCKWSYVGSDIPRVVDVDDSHICASTINNGVFAGQGNLGTEASPHLICNTTQLKAVSGTPGKYFSLAQSLNLLPVIDDTVGPFSGHFNGNNHILFSHTPTGPAVSKGLFYSISLNSSVRNLELAGFNYQTTGCPSCNLAPLVQTNNGLVTRVRVTDFKVSTASTTANVGGIASYNTGTISDSFVSGDISCSNNVGGVVAENQGTVTRNVSYLGYIGSGVVSQVGGVVGINYSNVTQNTYKGRINLTSVSSASRVGGIVGYLAHLTDPATVIDNHSSRDALIEVNGAVSSVAAIVGYSDDASDVVSRNVNSTLLYKPTNLTSVKAIVGSGTPTDLMDQNFAIASTYGQALPSTALSVATPSAPFCSISVLTGGAFFNGPGAFRIMNETYFGPLNGVANTWVLTIPASPTECVSSKFHNVTSGAIKTYSSWTPPDVPLVSDLKDSHYDVVDMNDNDDRARAIKAFIKIQEGEYPTDAPVWISEEEGLKLFSQVD